MARRRSRCGSSRTCRSSPTRPRRASCPTLEELLGDRSRTVLEGLLRFENAHPHDEPHYYLSFVATHDDHRGQGIGEQLLAENLELIDAEHFPAYLESSNPKNLERYGRLGFEPLGSSRCPTTARPSPPCGARACQSLRRNRGLGSRRLAIEQAGVAGRRVDHRCRGDRPASRVLRVCRRSPASIIASMSAQSFVRSKNALKTMSSVAPRIGIVTPSKGTASMWLAA